jgi:hypothetical protein
MAEYANDLPRCVIEYLNRHDVDPSSLPPNVHAVFKELGPKEVALLEKIGHAMEKDHFDQAKAARIH